MTRLDPELAARLREVGLDPADPGEPAAAWLRLYERFGRRATLIDRYALEGARRGIPPEELSADERRRLTEEVAAIRDPGFSVVPGSGRLVRDPIEVVPYDERWPALFAEWREKLQHALGDTALGIEHIGSTAVPGLAAKPVIDIQITVRDLEDEAAYVPAIEALGVALRSREPGHRYFRTAGDRPRTVQVHVYSAGSAAADDHLLFRDFLRGHREERESYAGMKRDVAARYRDDRIAYNEAKTGFILDVMERARASSSRRDPGAPLDLYRILRPEGEPELIHREVPNGASILELGCGTGRITHALVRLGHRVTAVDYDERMLREIEGAETVLSPIEDLDLGRTFDVVLLMSTLIDRPDRSGRLALLAACRRHVAPDGVVLIERYDPEIGKDPRPTARRFAGVTIRISDVRRDGPLLYALVEYDAGDGGMWRIPVEGRYVLSDDETLADLDAARLELRRWIDDRHKWLAATPVQM